MRDLFSGVKPIVLEKLREHAYVLYVHGHPVVDLDEGKAERPNLSWVGRPKRPHGQGAGLPPFEFKTKESAEHVAHMIGRYSYKLGDFVYSYVEYRGTRAEEDAPTAGEITNPAAVLEGNVAEAVAPAKEPECPPHRHEGDPTVRPCDRAAERRHAERPKGVSANATLVQSGDSYGLQYDIYHDPSRKGLKYASVLYEPEYDDAWAERGSDPSKPSIYVRVYDWSRTLETAVSRAVAELGHLWKLEQQRMRRDPNMGSWSRESRAGETATVLYEKRRIVKRGKSEKKAASADGHTTVSADDCDVCRPYATLRYDEPRREVCMKRAKEIGPIDNPVALGRLIRDDITSYTVETFVVVCTSLHGELRTISEVHRGTRDGVEVTAEDVMAVAIPTGTSNVFVAHAHPSGKPKPSKADISLLHHLDKAFKPMSRLTFVDHCVITPGHVHSIRDDKTYRLPSP